MLLVWRVVAIQDDAETVEGLRQSERAARLLFERLKRVGTHRLELQRSDGDEWVTLEASWLRIAPRINEEDRSEDVGPVVE